MITIDASKGGGQVLRTALTLATALNKPVEITGIRANRPNPGLQPQHLACINALAELAGAKTSGASQHSTKIEFTPSGKINEIKNIDVGTAGSVCLVAQCLLPVMLSSEKEFEVEITGGTHVNWSPSFEYFNEVFLPALRTMGCFTTTELIRNGFYPVGGGKIILKTNPSKFKSIKLLERGALKKITGESFSTTSIASVAGKQKTSLLRGLVDFELKVTEKNSDADSPGSFVFLKAEYENAIAGFTSLGERMKPSETVAKEAADALRDFNTSTYAVDEHLADQLMIYCAIAKGKTIINAKATEHIQSNASTINALFEKEVASVKDGEIRFR